MLTKHPSNALVYPRDGCSNLEANQRRKPRTISSAVVRLTRSRLDLFAIKAMKATNTAVPLTVWRWWWWCSRGGGGGEAVAIVTTACLKASLCSYSCYTRGISACLYQQENTTKRESSHGVSYTCAWRATASYRSQRSCLWLSSLDIEDRTRFMPFLHAWIHHNRSSWSGRVLVRRGVANLVNYQQWPCLGLFYW